MTLDSNDTELPEYSLEGRYQLAFNWTPQGVNNFLDAGCAWGYGTRFFKQKCRNVYGLDPYKEALVVAQKRYPEINFVHSNLESTPFESDFFDVIVLCDTLEHVFDEIHCLNEVFRILKKGGTVIITTPHKGLFAFMDPGNSIQWVEYSIKKNMPYLYKIAYKIRKGEYPKEVHYTQPIYEHDTTHRHYSKEEIVEMLDRSLFRDNYEIIETFRSGLFIEVFTMNLGYYTSLFMDKKVKSILLQPFLFLSRIDYWIPYNVLAYNIAIKIIKK